MSTHKPMIQSDYRAMQVRAKTREVRDYHNDDAKPGKPLHLLIPGGLIALGSLALIIYLLYLILLDQTLDPNPGYGMVALLTPVYIGSVYLFSYGYELYDIGRALRLTAIIVFITLSIVIIIAVLFALLANSDSSSSRSSESSSGSQSSHGSAKGKASWGGWFNTSSGARSTSSASSAPATYYPSGIDAAPIVFGGETTQVVERQVIHEVPAAPPEPKPTVCSFCHRMYIPADNNFVCPGCGAATSVNS